MSYKYQDIIDSTYHTAKTIIPIVTDIIGKPDFVIDVGGGTGAFLKAFKEQGTSKVICYDSPAVSEQDLLINKNEFVPIDLSSQMPEPVLCDLVITVLKLSYFEQLFRVRED
jgi:ribosomal protein L11 methylase PrmA